MTRPHRPRLRGPRLSEVTERSLRVALAATAIVAVAYLAISASVVMLVTRNLTDQIDQNLSYQLEQIATPPDDDDDGNGGPPQDRPLPDAQTYFWILYPDGTYKTNAAYQGQYVPLPDDFNTVTVPVNGSVDGTDLRLAGRQVGSVYVVVGQPLKAVSDTAASTIGNAAEVAPILSLVVFVGSVAHRAAGGHAGRTGAPPAARVHRRCLARAAHAALGDRGQYQPGTRRSLETSSGTRRRSCASTPSRSACGGCWRTCSGWRASTRRVARRMRSPLTSRCSQEPPPTASAPWRRRASLSLLVQSSVPDAVVNVPPEWLDRLLGVLLDNALKFSQSGGDVRVSVGLDGNRVQLTVDDSGPGIPEDERSRVFDRFHRGTESKSGAGLGLAIADAIVRATDGRWRIGSSPSGGASMSVSWPRAFSGPRESTVRQPAQGGEQAV